MKQVLKVFLSLFIFSFSSLSASDWIMDVSNSNGGAGGIIEDLLVTPTRMGNGLPATAYGEQGTFKGLTVTHVSGDHGGTRLIMDHITSKMVLEDSTLSLDGDYTFSQGTPVAMGNNR